ncbi:hypothetical protein AB0K60_28780 [Thermopolyspora sp. NPDC052614]
MSLGGRGGEAQGGAGGVHGQAAQLVGGRHGSLPVKPYAPMDIRSGGTRA